MHAATLVPRLTNQKCNYIFLKNCENNGEKISFILGFIDKYLFCHPYVTMPNVS